MQHVQACAISSVGWGHFKAFKIHTLADSGFFKNFLYQGGVKSRVFCVFENLKFKISEGYDQNWCFPDSTQLAVLAKLRR